MSYQKIDLVYGVTLSEEEYEDFKTELGKIGESEDEDEDDFYDIKETLGIVIYNGYYHDTYKVGFSIEEDEVRTMQDFVFDFSIPSEDELKKILKENADLITKLNLNPSDFTLGVCTENY